MRFRLLQPEFCSCIPKWKIEVWFTTNLRIEKENVEKTDEGLLKLNMKNWKNQQILLVGKVRKFDLIFGNIIRDFQIQKLRKCRSSRLWQYFGGTHNGDKIVIVAMFFALKVSLIWSVRDLGKINFIFSRCWAADSQS